MSGRRRREMPAELSRGRSRFDAWRRSRKLGTRIPDSLWHLAVKLADTHGIARTACVLRLDYYALKKRVEARRSDPAVFMELAAAPLPTSSECIIELENVAGDRMRVHLKGHDAPDLITLSRSFWGGE